MGTKHERFKSYFDDLLENKFIRYTKGEPYKAESYSTSLKAKEVFNAKQSLQMSTFLTILGKTIQFIGTK